MEKESKPDMASEERVLGPKEIGAYISLRMFQLFEGKSQPFADALGLTRGQFWALRKGKYGLSPDVLRRLNELDPEYNISRHPAYLVEPKKKTPGKAKAKPKTKI